ncbi:DEAD/DEAH box helicase [Halocatena halophila]|uniref:DEAD/DEAH box helicase n=1 Tax=Halocatena halophila TaxID=2814576 RepID=UPI002ED474EF
MAAGTSAIDLDHHLLTPELLERREYQLSLANTACSDHTLVSLATGLGKTTVSLLVTAHRLGAFEEQSSRALLLAPTKPLVEQHASFYREALTIDDERIVVFTGGVSPDDRAELFEDARVVVATPQVIENDLIANRISLETVVHCTFDECHRATGDYAYNYIAERYHQDAVNPLVTAMSASPGGTKEEILTVCENLGLSDVAVMTEADADVSEHTYETTIDWEKIELPEAIITIRDSLNDVIRDRLEALRELGVTNVSSPDCSQKQLNAMRGKLQRLIDAGNSDGYEGMSIHAELMKLRRAVELVETQSVESLRRYFERQRNAAKSSGASKAAQRFVSDPAVRSAMDAAESFDDLHPKFRRARILLAQTLGIDDGERVIVFTESRDTAETLTSFFNDHFETRKFVGQADTDGSDGMTQTEQRKTLEAFREGEFEVLVSTSVAEEGLDVPEVDLVLFYEPVPKGIRSIQRKGRTGRGREGHVVVLLAEDTRDEAFFWISRREEKRMQSELESLKEVAGAVRSELTPPGATHPTDEQSAQPQAGQTALDAFEQPAEPATEETIDGPKPTPSDEDGVEIVIDQRELDATIARSLSTRDQLTTRLETLDVGDYICSDRVVVERKSVSDFLDTIVEGDRSLFEQISAATRSYQRPIVLVEGSQDALFEGRNIHPNAIRGALSSLAIDFGASVLFTPDEDGTTELLATIAKREQLDDDRTVSVHGDKHSKTVAEQQEYVVSAIAEVGPVTAQALLSAFGTVENVMTATEDDLQTVSGVGEVTASRIRDVLTAEY